jgi:hypothetical protein
MHHRKRGWVHRHHTLATSVLAKFLFFILALPVYACMYVVPTVACSVAGMLHRFLAGPKIQFSTNFLFFFFFFSFSRLGKGWTRPPVQRPRIPICSLQQWLGGLPTPVRCCPTTRWEGRLTWGVGVFCMISQSRHPTADGCVGNYASCKTRSHNIAIQQATQ